MREGASERQRVTKIRSHFPRMAPYESFCFCMLRSPIARSAKLSAHSFETASSNPAGGSKSFYMVPDGHNAFQCRYRPNITELREN